MVPLMSLWISVLLSAVLVFVASSIIHMLLKYHRSDFAPLPGESSILEGMRQENIRPGDYAFPCPASPEDMRSPEMVKKYEQGPVGFMTIMPSGTPAMGTSLIQWFVYSLIIGILVAYVTGRTVAPEAEYLQIFRVAGTVAFIGYAGAHPVASIWSKRKWSTTVKYVIDGLIYSLLTAGAFAGLWPA